MPQSRSFNALDVEDSGVHGQSPLLATIDSENDSVTTQRAPPSRQPSISRPGTPRTPRTANRVRFDIQETSHIRTSNDQAEEWLEEEDYFSRGRRGSTAQRAPLLTGIEAPSVTAALEINIDDLLETARPKSGMSSAFMNMANSIIGAGIIGRLLLKKKMRTHTQHECYRTASCVQASWDGHRDRVTSGSDSSRMFL